MGIKNLPEETDGRTINSATGQRNRGQTTRMSIDLTREEQKEFLMEAVDHNLTLRGYFYHCWRNSQQYEKLHGGDDEGTTSVADAAVATAKKRMATDA